MDACSRPGLTARVNHKQIRLIFLFFSFFTSFVGMGKISKLFVFVLVLRFFFRKRQTLNEHFFHQVNSKKVFSVD